jgi:hypothetical protein
MQFTIHESDNKLNKKVYLGYINPMFSCCNFKIRKMKMNKKDKRYLEAIVIASVLRVK